MRDGVKGRCVGQEPVKITLKHASCDHRKTLTIYYILQQDSFTCTCTWNFAFLPQTWPTDY